MGISRWLEMGKGGAGLGGWDGFPFGHCGCVIPLGCPGWDDLRFIGYTGLELGPGRDEWWMLSPKKSVKDKGGDRAHSG